MNIKDRLAFLKAGYTKDEINAMIEEDSKAQESPEPVNTEPKIEDFMSVISSLADEVKNVKKAIQNKNIQDTSITSDQSDTIDQILASVINPKQEEK